MKINQEQRLYVISEGQGYTCLGFDVCEQRSRRLAEWLKETSTEIPAPGTEEAYQHYRDLLEKTGTICKSRGIRCPVELAPQLCGLERRRVEVVDCYGETRRFWVGNSTGWLPIHLEVKRSDSTGGIAVSGTPFQRVRIIR
jgi:hypothetical protein